MRALIIGASGQVGKRLMALGAQHQAICVGTANKRAASAPPSHPIMDSLDISDQAQVERVFGARAPDVVFLSAALSAVDVCEQNPDLARRINVDGVRHVAESCAKAGAKLVFISTDYVFDGTNGPYTESSVTSPTSVYGRTKVEGEQIALGVKESIVARTSVVYDWDPDSVNFAMQTIKKLSAGERCNVVKDQLSHPTLARDLAEALWRLVERGEQGIFHVVGPDYLSRYDFALKIAGCFGLDRGLISPVATSALKQPARRPLHSDLSSERLEKLWPGLINGVKEGLLQVKRDYDPVALGSRER